MIRCMTMSTQRITITLPDDMADRLRKEARKRQRPVSRLVADAILEQEKERILQLMAEGYREAAALNKELAEEFWPIASETWPDD